MIRKIHTAYHAARQRLASWRQAVWPDVVYRLGPREKGRFVDAAVSSLALHIRRIETMQRLRTWLIVSFFLFGLAVSAYRLNAWDRLFGTSEYAATVVISGDIASDGDASSASLIPAIRNAFASDRSKFVVLKINSGGGSPVEAEKIVDAIHIGRQKTGKKVYAFIEETGASAAYMIALESDAIYAGRYSIVGSIGAVLSAWEFRDALERLDVRQKTYSSGEYKGMLNPFSAPSPTVDARINQVVSRLADGFYEEVKTKRGDRLKTTEPINNGNIWTGPEAQRLGLIDGIKTLPQFAEENGGIPLRSVNQTASAGYFTASLQDALTGAFRAALRDVMTSHNPVTVR